MWQSRLYQVEHAVDVRAKRLIPLVIGDIVDARVACLERGVIDENVEAAELLDGSVDEFTAMRRIRYIAWNQDRPPSASSTQRAVSLASSCSQRYEISRSAPSRAKAIATARPIQESAPVISAARPANLPLPR